MMMMMYKKIAKIKHRNQKEQEKSVWLDVFLQSGRDPHNQGWKSLNKIPWTIRNDDKVLELMIDIIMKLISSPQAKIFYCTHVWHDFPYGNHIAYPKYSKKSPPAVFKKSVYFPLKAKKSLILRSLYHIPGGPPLKDNPKILQIFALWLSIQIQIF